MTLDSDVIHRAFSHATATVKSPEDKKAMRLIFLAGVSVLCLFLILALIVMQNPSSGYHSNDKIVYKILA